MKNKFTSLITDPGSARFVVSAFLAVFFLSSDKIIQPTEAHGYMTSPRTRNQFAAEDGKDVPTAGYPPREYCTHCLNTNSGVCGKVSFVHLMPIALTADDIAWILQTYIYFSFPLCSSNYVFYFQKSDKFAQLRQLRRWTW